MRQERERLAALLSSPLGAWAPWRTPEGECPQGEFLRAAETHRTRLFRSGNRVGKSTAGAADTLLHLLGWHPWGRFRPPCRWWASGLDWEFGVGQVLWPALRDLMPWSEVQSVTWARKRAPELPLYVRFKNGSELVFKTADSGARKYQGAKLHGLWVDEEHPPEVIEEARARLLDLGGYFTATLTPVQRMRWVQDLEREPGTKLIRASMLDAARAGLLDEQAVLDYAAQLPERQRQVRVHGEFVALEGLVYPEFRESSHVAEPDGHGQLVARDGTVLAPWPLPPTWPRFAAIDFGYVNPTAVGVAVLDPAEDRLIVERVYYASGIRASEWGELLRSRLPRLEIPPVADHDALARAELEAEGHATTPARKEIDLGLEAVARWLHEGRIVLVEDGATDDQLGRCDAAILRHELESYHYPRVREDRPDPKDVPVKKDDHALDQLRYMVREVEDWLGGGPTPPRAYEDEHDDEDAPPSLWDGMVSPSRSIM